jgi:molecular chaperone DnaK
MAIRSTIDFGIDLGTTNSTIAVIDGVDARVIPNKAGSTVTPSAVWINPRGNLQVGTEAKERTLCGDRANGATEFKLSMGGGDEAKIVFARTGRAMLPEQLSAEVLKSLRTDVYSSMGEEVGSAVITVPAAFNLPQSKATQAAAELAGFAVAPLMLEPVAASLAYGFQSESENAYWFVYDFGGGTFDAALMRVRDGLIQVVNHHGDNYLGGKLIDWDLITKCLMPALAAQYSLPDFIRGNPRWDNPLGRLKFEVEKAKIEVCRTRQAVEIYVECLCEDANGKPVEVIYTLTPREVEEIGLPYVARTLDLSRRTLEEKSLKGSSLDRVLMVGGSTLNPWVREAVESELGATLEFGIDPVTVVARGAAIFASTQRLPDDPTVTVPRGTWRVQIELEPVGNESDPDLGGRIVPEGGAAVAGCTIELRDKQTKWTTGRIPVSADGTFMTQLYAERQRRCEFEIELLDAKGRRIPTQPDHTCYTIGPKPAPPPCPQTVGIGLADGTVAQFIRKGQPLPAQGQQDRRTTSALRAGNPEDRVRIPVVEGEHPRFERNRLIGDLIIKGTDVKKDLPAGSQIEVTVKLEAALMVDVWVYVPRLEEEFKIEFDLKMVRKSPEALRQDLVMQKARLTTVQADVGPEHPAAGQALDRITREGMIAETEALAEAAARDPDALVPLDRRLQELAAALDQAEDAMAWPKALAEAEETKDLLQQLIADLKSVTSEDRTLHKRLLTDLQRAIERHDTDQLRRCIDAMDELRFEILRREPGFWLARLEDAQERLESMTDIEQAKRLIAQANRAVQNNDVEGLKSAVRQLYSLLPIGPGPDERYKDLPM